VALPGLDIRDMTGVPLDQSLRALSTCRFYVAHAGSMQHKCAWFYPLPGIIHGNRASLSPGALRWNAQQVAETVEPRGIGPEMLRDTVVRGLPAQNDRNRDYVITDIPQAVAAVLRAYEASRCHAASASSPAA
jgi:hypothetical protein